MEKLTSPCSASLEIKSASLLASQRTCVTLALRDLANQLIISFKSRFFLLWSLAGLVIHLIIVSESPSNQISVACKCKMATLIPNHVATNSPQNTDEEDKSLAPKEHTESLAS